MVTAVDSDRRQTVHLLAAWEHVRKNPLARKSIRRCCGRGFRIDIAGSESPVRVRSLNESGSRCAPHAVNVSTETKVSGPELQQTFQTVCPAST